MVCNCRQSKKLRDLSSTIDFEIDQMTGGAGYTERMSMYCISFAKGYEDLGIETAWPQQTIGSTHARVALNDDVAELLASLSVEITAELCRRNLSFTHGLPRRQTLLISPEHSAAFLEEFRQDLHNFETIQRDVFPGQEAFLARSVFQLASVQQLVGVLKDTGFQITPRSEWA